MDLSNDVEDRLPGARTDKQDPTIDPVGSIVTGSPGSGLVLRVGRQGRDRGEFINPQGICYSDADGGLVLVADSYCACVQVSCFRFNVAHSFFYIIVIVIIIIIKIVPEVQDRHRQKHST